MQLSDKRMNRWLALSFNAALSILLIACKHDAFINAACPITKQVQVQIHPSLELIQLMVCHGNLAYWVFFVSFKKAIIVEHTSTVEWSAHLVAILETTASLPKKTLLSFLLQDEGQFSTETSSIVKTAQDPIVTVLCWRMSLYDNIAFIWIALLWSLNHILRYSVQETFSQWVIWRGMNVDRIQQLLLIDCPSS